MTARHTGTVSYIDAETNFGEITSPGWQPIGCDLADLRRVGADAIGAVVDFEFGAFRSAVSGAINISKPRLEP